MKSKYLAGLTGIGLLAGLVVACGDSSSTGTGGTGTTSTSTTGSTSSKGGVTVATSTSSGMMGDGNDTLATATQLMADANGVVATDPQNPPTLDPPDTDVDFYKFTATKGPWYFSAQGQPQGKAFTAGYLDTVITVYDSSMKQIAQNDDPFPRTSQNGTLATILPADGTYYVKVEEFCESALATTACPASYFASITDNTYTFFATKFATDASDVPEAAEPNNTLATATAMPYGVTMTAGTYYLSVIWGTLTPASDADWVKFTIPSDVTVDAASRLSATFVLPPPTTKGNGSNVNPGVVQIVDPTNSNAIVGELDFTAAPIDATRADINIPLLPNHEYVMKLPFGSAAADGAGDFYFIEHSVGGGNPWELEGKNNLTNANDTFATAETLTGAMVSGGGQGFFVEGDLPAGDVADFFKVPVGTGTKTSVACAGVRSGSGLSVKATVLANDGTTSIFSDTETASHDITITDKPVTGNTNVYVKIEGTGSATVTSRSYRCGIYINP